MLCMMKFRNFCLYAFNHWPPVNFIFLSSSSFKFTFGRTMIASNIETFRQRSKLNSSMLSLSCMFGGKLMFLNFADRKFGILMFGKLQESRKRFSILLWLSDEFNIRFLARNSFKFIKFLKDNDKWSVFTWRVYISVKHKTSTNGISPWTKDVVWCREICSSNVLIFGKSRTISRISGSFTVNFSIVLRCTFRKFCFVPNLYLTLISVIFSFKTK